MGGFRRPSRDRHQIRRQSLSRDLFEFLRNQTFDAKNYFTPAGTTPALNRNQYGGTFGGPIRKDKTFFFVIYEGLQLSQQYIALSTVPTPSMAGVSTPGTYDFRSLLSLPTPVHVKNPFTNKDFITPNVISSADLNGTGSGAVPILSTAASQLGVSLASFYPKQRSPHPQDKRLETTTISLRLAQKNSISLRCESIM